MNKQIRISQSLIVLTALFAGLLTAQKSHAFIEVFCSTVWDDDADTGIQETGDYQYILKGYAQLKCSTVSLDSGSATGIGAGRTFNITFDRVGFGLSGGGALVTIICPLVDPRGFGHPEYVTNKGVTKKTGADTYYGLSAQAGAFAGAEAGVFADHAGGVCIMAGPGMILGAGVEGA